MAHIHNSFIFCQCLSDPDPLNKCEHKSKKALERKKISEEQLPCAYAATVTTTTYEILYEFKGCGEKRTESKEETKLD
jgi:hypothetical protein